MSYIRMYIHIASCRFGEDFNIEDGRVRDTYGVDVCLKERERKRKSERNTFIIIIIIRRITRVHVMLCRCTAQIYIS